MKKHSQNLRYFVIYLFSVNDSFLIPIGSKPEKVLTTEASFKEIDIFQRYSYGKLYDINLFFLVILIGYLIIEFLDCQGASFVQYGDAQAPCPSPCNNPSVLSGLIFWHIFEWSSHVYVLTGPGGSQHRRRH